MLTIAWDVDDVLNQLMKNWFNDEWKSAHQSNGVSYEMLRQNPPHECLGVSRQEYLDSLDSFRMRNAYRALEPNSIVADWFACTGGSFHHCALTAVPFFAITDSASWVMKHFGKWIRSYNFIPSPRTNTVIPQYDATKGEFIARTGNIDVLIDDSEENIAQALLAGIHGILFPQPWNSAWGKTVQNIFTEIETLQTRKKHD